MVLKSYVRPLNTYGPFRCCTGQVTDAHMQIDGSGFAAKKQLTPPLDIENGCEATLPVSRRCVVTTGPLDNNEAEKGKKILFLPEFRIFQGFVSRVIQIVTRIHQCLNRR